jgi:hypothetical protein
MLPSQERSSSSTSTNSVEQGSAVPDVQGLLRLSTNVRDEPIVEDPVIPSMAAATESAAADEFGELTDFDDDPFEYLDRAAPAEWREDWARIRTVMGNLGFVGTKLCMQSDDIEAFLVQLAESCGVVLGDRKMEFLLLQVQAKVETAVLEEPSRKRLRGLFLPEFEYNIYMASTASVPGHWAGKAIKQALQSREEGQAQLPLPPRGSRGRGALSWGESESTKHSWEERELLKLMPQFVSYITESDGPAFHEARLAANPDSALARLIGKTRYRTVLKYVRRWRGVRSWCISEYRMPWPKQAHHISDYLEARAGEPCAPTVIGSIIQAVDWMEKKAGYREADRVARTALVMETKSSLAVQLQQPNPTAQAPRFPVGMLLSMELYSNNAENPWPLRRNAESHLCRSWATLRLDDMQELGPKSWIQSPAYFTATLKRTKTTGAERRVKELPVVISRDLSFSGVDCLSSFLKDHAENGPPDRNSMLWNTGLRRFEKYGETAANTR